mmetsp:Transcript_50618/g.120757  ORF Transcript_50618/g.120757 Transcript_50618/m.120757 type:complete len:207 (+) Transcript_50618:264-884(+)
MRADRLPRHALVRAVPHRLRGPPRRGPRVSFRQPLRGRLLGDAGVASGHPGHLVHLADVLHFGGLLLDLLRPRGILELQERLLLGFHLGVGAAKDLPNPGLSAGGRDQRHGVPLHSGEELCQDLSLSRRCCQVHENAVRLGRSDLLSQVDSVSGNTRSPLAACAYQPHSFQAPLHAPFLAEQRQARRFHSGCSLACESRPDGGIEA